MYNVHVFSTIDTESLDLDENGIVTWPAIYMTKYDMFNVYGWFFTRFNRQGKSENLEKNVSSQTYKPWIVTDWQCNNVWLYAWTAQENLRNTLTWGGAHPARVPRLKLEKIWSFGVKSWFFTRNTPTIFAPPSAIGKNMIFWRKIVIFHTKYPKNVRASLSSAPNLTWNPGSGPAGNYSSISKEFIMVENIFLVMRAQYYTVLHLSKNNCPLFLKLEKKKSGTRYCKCLKIYLT